MKPLTLDPLDQPNLHLARVFEDRELRYALDDALEFAGEHGAIATAPEILEMKMADTDRYRLYRGPRRYDHSVSATEEFIHQDPKRREWYIVAHGAGLLIGEGRKIPTKEGGFVRGQINNRTAPLEYKEIEALFQGKTPQKGQLPVHRIDELTSQGVNIEQQGIIILPYDLVRRENDIPIYTDQAVRSPLFIARCGAVDRAQRYATWFAQYQTNQGTIMNAPANYVDPSIPQGWLLRVGSVNGIGLQPADFLDEARVVASQNRIGPPVPTVVKVL